jgi:hypothetical protein
VVGTVRVVAAAVVAGRGRSQTREKLPRPTAVVPSGQTWMQAPWKRYCAFLHCVHVAPTHAWQLRRLRQASPVTGPETREVGEFCATVVSQHRATQNRSTASEKQAGIVKKCIQKDKCSSSKNTLLSDLAPRGLLQ